MRGRLRNISTIGFALVAIAIVAATLHLRRDAHHPAVPPSSPAASADPLAAELAHCQTLAMAAKDDAGCEKTWAENRRRFFTYAPASTPAPQTKTSDR